MAANGEKQWRISEKPRHGMAAAYLWRSIISENGGSASHHRPQKQHHRV